MSVRPACIGDLASLVELEMACEGDDAWSENLIREGVAGLVPTTTWFVSSESLVEVRAERAVPVVEVRAERAVPVVEVRAERAAKPGDVEFPVVEERAAKPGGEGGFAARSLGDARTSTGVGGGGSLVEERAAQPGVGGGEAVAYAVVCVAGDIAELQRIGVAADSRRQGLAAALLDAAIVHGSRAGADRMLLEVREDNHAALNLYASKGFVEIDRRRRYYKDGATAVVMRLPLMKGCG